MGDDGIICRGDADRARRGIVAYKDVNDGDDNGNNDGTADIGAIIGVFGRREFILLAISVAADSIDSYGPKKIRPF